MKNSMKKYIYSAFAAVFALALFSAVPTSAGAATVTWNNFSNDCKNTTIIANDTTQENAGPDCWGSSVTAKGGEKISVGVWYHNTSSVDALNTTTHINTPTGKQTAFTFNGFVASGSTQAAGPVLVNFTDGKAHSLKLISVVWMANKTINQTPMPLSTTQNLGTIPSASSCGGDSYCHLGLVRYMFEVSNDTVTQVDNGGSGDTCTINYLTPSKYSVKAGEAVTLSWGTTGCAVASLELNRAYVSVPVNGARTTDPLQYTTTYTLEANATGYRSRSLPVTVTVSGATAGCVISSFKGVPENVNSGSASTLTWATSGCTSVAIAGNGAAGTSYAANGSTSTGPLTKSMNYLLTAYGDGNNASAAATVTVSGGGSSNACSLTSFSASPSNVVSGNSTTLSWNATGCASVTLSGDNFTNVDVTGRSSYSTSALYTTTQYTLTGTVFGAPNVYAYTTVTTDTVSSCGTPSFYASPTVVAYGSSTTLYWNASGCTNVHVWGPGVNSYSVTGSQSVGPITGSTDYTLTTNTTTRTVTVTNTSVSNMAPVATTTAATNTTGGTATFNGYITSNSTGCSYNCYSNVNYYFQYGTSQYSLYSQTPTQTMSGTYGNVSTYVSNLLPNTTYYFQLVATSTGGTSYGGTLSFYTNNGGTTSGIAAITSLVTNVNARSVRFNGLVIGTNNIYNGTAYFEYGTSPVLGYQTAAQSISGTTSSNYFDTITTNPNTTYYYRIVASVNGQTYPGSTVAFTTPAATVINTTNTNTNTNTTIVTRVGTGGGSSFVSLSITDQPSGIAPGDSVTYTVNYQNISNVTLTKAVLNVILPTGITFRSSSQGVLTTNNTVAADLGTLVPGAQGTIIIQAVADMNVLPGNTLVTTATIAFTAPYNAQDSAVAYVLNNVVNRNSLTGLALFGYGFFPSTLLGWILLIGLIIILLLIARYFYHRGEADRRMAAPAVNHVHYDTPAPRANTSHDDHGSYHGNNLPH